MIVGERIGEMGNPMTDSDASATMSVQEAIFCMASYMPGNHMSCVNGCPHYGSILVSDNPPTYVCRSSEAHQLATEALSRQMPVPAIDGTCPKCGHVMNGDGWRYCPHCGQRIMVKGEVTFG